MKHRFKTEEEAIQAINNPDDEWPFELTFNTTKQVIEEGDEEEEEEAELDTEMG
jgi:hypothetical protein